MEGNEIHDRFEKADSLRTVKSTREGTDTWSLAVCLLLYNHGLNH